MEIQPDQNVPVSRCSSVKIDTTCSRAVAEALLRAAFPGPLSLEERAARASQRLSVSKRTVRRVLQHDTDVKFGSIYPLLRRRLEELGLSIEDLIG